MKISVIAPILNENPWVGYSILSCLEQVHEFIYALDESSDDGTKELLHHIKDKYAHKKLTILDHPTFKPHDMTAYNEAFNRCIREATGEACFFLHPDMIVTQWSDIQPGNALAWWTTITSYAGDFQTVITKGRADRWKNMHARKFGLKYFGAYGSINEDFYHTEITGKSCRHFGTEFAKYPFEVANSGIEVAHFCELKPYKRRLEKMKLCLKTQNPTATDDWVEERAVQHPRVTLESSSPRFGSFEFSKTDRQVPDVIQKYEQEFSQFEKERELIHG